MSEARNKYMAGIAPNKPKGLFSGRGILTGRFVDSVFQPSLIFQLLKPRKETGNAINGLGETLPRRARKTYHWLFSDSKNYPFLLVNWIFILKSRFSKESLQAGFMGIFRKNLELMKATRKMNMEKLSPTIPRVQRSKQEWGRLIKERAIEFGAVDVGICEVDDHMLYEHQPAPGKYIIVLASPMSQEVARKLPSAEGSCATMQAYYDSNKVGYNLSQWLRGQGVEAKGSDILPESLIVPPAAVKAGLGQLGKHGSVIHPEFGSLVRFNYVAVNIELPTDKRIAFGVDEFCAHCQVCTLNCPPQAMIPTTPTVRGVEKWYVDFDKCVPYFNDNHGCGRCLAVCPWSQPQASDSFIHKMLKQKKKLAELTEQSSLLNIE